MTVALVVGSRGQFDVLADGELIASRRGNILVRAVGGGFPSADDVIAALRPRLPPH